MAGPHSHAYANMYQEQLVPVVKREKHDPEYERGSLAALPEASRWEEDGTGEECTHNNDRY